MSSFLCPFYGPRSPWPLSQHFTPELPASQPGKKKRRNWEQKKRKTTFPGHRAAGLNGTRYLLWLWQQKQQPNRTTKKAQGRYYQKIRRAEKSLKKWFCRRPLRLEKIKLVTGTEVRLQHIILQRHKVLSFFKGPKRESLSQILVASQMNNNLNIILLKIMTRI